MSGGPAEVPPAAASATPAIPPALLGGTVPPAGGVPEELRTVVGRHAPGRPGVPSGGSRVPATVPAGMTVEPRHQVIRLADGQRVGISVAGAGIPLVFLHGIALNRRIYSDFLSTLPQLGFLTVAVDAPAHGDTSALPGRSTFQQRAAVIDRTLDELGIARCVLVGHSMGGRNAIELAAARPDRVLAAVLLDAAAGDRFDRIDRRAARRVPTLVAALARARWDARGGTGYLTPADRARYRRLGRELTMLSVRAPGAVRRTARAIADSGDTTAMLTAMRSHGTPTVVVHGQRDLVIPVASAHDVARAGGGSLYLLPDAYHCWMLSDANLGCAVLAQLLSEDLGAILESFRAGSGLPDTPTAHDWHGACLDPGAAVLDLLAEPVTTGRVADYYGPRRPPAVRVDPGDR